MTNLPFNGEFRVTVEYGRKNSANLKWAAGYHTGMDLVGVTSKDVYSVCDGTVIFASTNGNYGKCVKIRDSKTGKVFLFAHLASISVKKGQSVTRATKLGVMGATGRAIGAHLHIELRTRADKYGFVENIANYMGIPNKVGTYNSANYQLGNKNITYQVHIQDIGWQTPKKNWEIAGTEGQEKRIEAIIIHSDIPLRYRAHIQDKGWSNWKFNDGIAGTTGEAKRLEALEIVSERPLKGQAHVQNKGWQDIKIGSPIILGTTGEGLRLEAIRLDFV